MLPPPSAAEPLFMGLSVAFAQPTFQRMVPLAVGAILTMGRRTVTAALRTLGGLARGDPSTYHRVFSRAAWSLWPLGKALAAAILERTRVSAAWSRRKGLVGLNRGRLGFSGQGAGWGAWAMGCVVASGAGVAWGQAADPACWRRSPMPQRIQPPITNTRPTVGRISCLAEPSPRPIHAEPVQRTPPAGVCQKESSPTAWPWPNRSPELPPLRSPAASAV